MFSKAIGSKHNQNEDVFISDFEPHLSNVLTPLGCSVQINKLNGRGKTWQIDFKCQFENDFKKLKLRHEILRINPQKAMKLDVANNLNDNQDIKKALLNSFQLGDQIRENLVIMSVTVIGTADNDIAVNEVLTQHNNDKREIEKKLTVSLLKSKPLHLFSVENVCDMIKWWMLNDCKQHQNFVSIIKVFAKKKSEPFNGEKIISNEGNDLHSLLKNKIAQYMTDETFDIIVNYLNYLATKNPKHLTTKTAPEIADTIWWCVANKLIEYVKTENVNGKEFLRRYEEKK
eukprot:13721_1